MRKIAIVLFIGCFILVGCSNKEEKYKNILQNYAPTYYNKYMSGVDNQDQAEITLKMFKMANEYNNEFDLSNLDKCSDDTAIILNLDEQKNIIGCEFDLKCN